MRSLISNAVAIFRLQPAGGILASVGRNQYHSYNIPIIKTIDDETHVKIKLGIGKQVELRIRYPPRPESNSPIIIFLRRGIPTPTQCESHLKDLAVGANATAVEINYRLSTQNGYPLPIHMVLAGYDWTRANLARGIHTGYKGLRMTTKPSKIGVCGELAGGSLATMLALTECFYTPAELEPQGISALAVGNPILDWTALTPSFARRNAPQAGLFRKVRGFPGGANNESLSVNGLCDIREAFFSKAERYFDPFASPLLFFRTPSSEIPNQAATSTEESLLNGGPEDENFFLPPAKKRLSARKYPPAGSNLMLPWTRVVLGKDCEFKDQGVDLVELMRKSFRRSEVERTADAKPIVRRNFEVEEREGIGLWDEKHMLEIGQWFGEKLRKP
ncbi:hypothetical protein HO133_007874 [Letharia lupina]|uniref:Alpha/beta hydrolase fold-3 domain-containing protein n=1 Tax=Letharia lupina TaxID=560253 RepID=A0A8H6CRG7_9LECA|nr:uncharacterized protein HO133_007874 [Letharia lupina]KAF6228144.1 hypothetical protein HO133_007874 [Letharia lupina]